MTFIQKAVVFSVIAVAAGSFVSMAITGAKVEAKIPDTITIDNTPAKIEALKQDVLTRLSSQCETKGLGKDAGAIILDTNNKMSIGPFMFQKGTVKTYYHQLYGKDVTGQEAVEIAIDYEKSAALAHDIIFKTKNGVEMDWTNCSNKLNLQTEVDLIKRMEK